MEVVEDEHAKKNAMHVVQKTHVSSKFSSNSEANATELLENLEEMYPCN